MVLCPIEVEWRKLAQVSSASDHGSQMQNTVPWSFLRNIPLCTSVPFFLLTIPFLPQASNSRRARSREASRQPPDDVPPRRSGKQVHVRAHAGPSVLEQRIPARSPKPSALVGRNLSCSPRRSCSRSGIAPPPADGQAAIPAAADFTRGTHVLKKAYSWRLSLEVLPIESP